jgi:hypothetical protein
VAEFWTLGHIARKALNTNHTKGNMTEETYRIIKLILLTSFVVGALIIGGMLSARMGQLAANGRYIQYDRQKDMVTTGNATTSYPTQIIDTRTGAVYPSVRPGK